MKRYHPTRDNLLVRAWKIESNSNISRNELNQLDRFWLILIYRKSIEIVHNFEQFYWKKNLSFDFYLKKERNNFWFFEVFLWIFEKNISVTQNQWKELNKKTLSNSNNLNYFQIINNFVTKTVFFRCLFCFWFYYWFCAKSENKRTDIFWTRIDFNDSELFVLVSQANRWQVKKDCHLNYLASQWNQSKCDFSNIS